MPEETVCRVVSRVFEFLARKVFETYMSRNVDPKIIKEDLKKIREFAERFSKESRCPIDLYKIDKLIEEADEDAEEIDSIRRSLT